MHSIADRFATRARDAGALTLRRATLAPASIDESGRTVEVVAATTAGVPRRDGRGSYTERLDMDGFDPARLVGGSVLNAHKRNDIGDVIGVVVEAWREGDKLIARLKIDDAKVWARIKSGVLRSVSIGYEVTKFVESRANGARVLTAAAWVPREVSFVPVPADAATVTRSRAEGDDETVVDDDAPAEDAPSDLDTARDATDAALQAERDAGDTLAAERSARLAEIRSRGANVRAAVVTRDMRSQDDPTVRAERMGEALFARQNPTHRLSEPARQFAHASTVELARMALRARGISTTGLSPAALVTRAMETTSDFPLAMGNFTNRELRAGYEAAPSALRQAARQSTAKDFRLKQKIQVETAAKLEKVGEHGEFKHGAHVEAAESYKIDTFGKIISISRQVLVNDDLGWTADLARGLGREAAAFEARFLVDLLLANSGFGPVMADGNELFDAAHGNLGVAAALGEAPLSAGRLAMRKQTSLNGEIIGIGPKFLIVPSDLETAAEKLLATITPATVADVNPMNFLTPLVEPRLTSATRYYLAADPAQVEGLEYAYLAGAPGPQTETKVGFEIDGVAVKVRLDFGAGFVDHRGWFMNAGA